MNGTYSIRGNTADGFTWHVSIPGRPGDESDTFPTEAEAVADVQRAHPGVPREDVRAPASGPVIGIGSAVVRISGGGSPGRKGSVVEINATQTRFRVLWLNWDGTTDKRTWVARKFIRLA